MIVESQHLDLEDLLAGARGAPSAKRARAHLAECAECRAETSGWAAVAAGIRYLAADVATAAVANPESAPAPRSGKIPPGRRTLLAIGAAAAAAAGLLVAMLPGHAPLTRPLHTAWQPARALPAPPVSPAAGVGRWRLASYLVSEGWQRDTAGPEPGNLTCPTAGTCYVEGDNATSASGPADMDSFFVSHDGGRSWSVLPVPTGLTFTTALSCGSAEGCAAGGRYNGQPVLVSTSNGGHTWVISPLPAAGSSVIFQLSCPATTTCGALLTTSPSQLPAGQFYYGGVTFLRTTDAGQHFVISTFPAGTAVQALSCPSASSCTAIGVSSTEVGRNKIAYHGLSLVTTDGGVTWTSGRLPAGFGPGVFPQVTCPDQDHCFALGTQSRNINFGEVAATADAGRSWTERPVPSSLPLPQLSAISCPADAACYVSGTEAVSQRFGKHGYNGGSAMVLVTADAGASWTRVTFPVPRGRVSGDLQGALMDIGGIQCPRVGTCVALGVGQQGSRSTPVYTYGVAP